MGCSSSTRTTCATSRTTGTGKSTTCRSAEALAWCSSRSRSSKRSRARCSTTRGRRSCCQATTRESASGASSRRRSATRRALSGTDINPLGDIEMNVIQQLEKEQQKAKVPALRAGDTVKVHAKVVEGTRERIQVFEGIVIRVTGGGLRQNFTVRRVTHGVGVERTFLVHSPRIDRIDVLRHGDVRQGRLYYLRGKVGKGARIRERRGALAAVAEEAESEVPETTEGTEQGQEK